MDVLNLKFGYFGGWVFPYISFFVGEGSSILGTERNVSHVSCVETQERYLVDPCHLLGEVKGETDLGDLGEGCGGSSGESSSIGWVKG